MKEKIFTSILLLMISINLKAWEAFSVDGIDYVVQTDSTVFVTHKKGDVYSGTLIIPNTVSHKGNTYKVTGLYDNAFAGCKELYDIYMPKYMKAESIYLNGHDFPHLYNIYVDESNPYMKSVDGILFSKDETKLLCYPPSKEARIYNIPNGVKSVNVLPLSAFEGTQYLEKLCIPASVEGSPSIRWTSIKQFDVDEDNPYIRSIDGIIFSKDSCTLLKYPAGKEDREYDIPNYVTRINEEAFFNCKNVEKVLLPNSIDSIGSRAFSSCENLKSLNLPNNISEISDNVFYLTDIEKFSITDNPKYFSENGVLFKREDDKISLYAYPNGKSDIAYSIPDYTDEIEVYAFGGTKHLKDVYLNKQVSYIPDTPESSIENIYVDQDNPYSYSVDGVLYSKDLAEYVTFPIGRIVKQNSYIFDKYLKRNITVCFGYLKEYHLRKLVINSYGEILFAGISSLQIDTIEIHSKAVSLLYTPSSFFYGMTLLVPYGTKEEYEANPLYYYCKEIKELPRDSATITLTSNYATYCGDDDLDFTNVEGLKAYTVVSYNKSDVTLARAFDVRSGTGLLLAGKPGTYRVPYKDAETVYANFLKGTTEETTIYQTDGEYTNFVLANKNGAIGFYKVQEDGGKIAANKAYLQIPSYAVSSVVAAKGYSFSFVDTEELTGVKGIKEEINEKNEWYNLNGQKVNNPGKGIYIHNGKKTIIK